MKKIYIFLTTSLFTFQILNAQQWDWALHINGNSTADMDQDASGNIYTSVVLSSTPPFSTEVKKLDPSGNQVWVKTLDCVINDIAVGTNSIALGGYFSGSETIEGQSLTSLNSWDGVVIDLDLNGTFKWIKQSAGIGNDNISSLQLNGADDVFVTNISDTVTNFAGLTFAKGLDVCVFNSAGGLTDNFHIYFEHPLFSTGKLTIDGSDNIYLQGVYRDSSITIGSTVVTNTDTYYGAYYIAKIHRNGAEYWAFNMGSQYRRELSNIAIANSGEFYMSSMSVYLDEYLHKYSPSGALLWTKMSGSHTYPGIREIKLDNSANLYIVGNTWMNATIGSCTAMGTDNFLYVGKADSSGNCIWTLSGDAPTYNSALKIGLRGSKPVVLGSGSATETIQLGAVSVQGSYFLATISESLAGINDLSATDNSVIFPNPNSGVFTLDPGVGSPVRICIYDCLSRCVYDNILDNSTRIDLSNKTKGIYFVKIINDQNHAIDQKIIVN